MAKKFVDAAIETEQESMTLEDGSAAVKTEQESMTLEDGSALTLTNGVRVLYDDTLEKGAIVVLLERIKNAILRLEPH